MLKANFRKLNKYVIRKCSTSVGHFFCDKWCDCNK